MSSYLIKKIRYHGHDVPILLQNENGPCPLLAAANVLLLRNVIELPNSCLQLGQIQLEDLVTTLANRVLEPLNSSNPKAVEDMPHPAYNPELSMKVATETNINENKPDESFQRKIQQVDDLISALPTLSKGLDLNPKFTSGPTGYEYTANVAVFDALGINLVHGWIVDPQGEEIYQLLNTQTYNQLMDTIVNGSDVTNEIIKLESIIEAKEAGRLNDGKSTDTDKNEWINVEYQEGQRNDKMMTDEANEVRSDNEETELDHNSSVGLIDVTDQNISELNEKLSNLRDLAYRCHLLRQFLEDTRSQLTHFGLTQLHEHITNDSLCVFFRNDHFSTLTKKNGCLYLLVTDVGYSDVSEIVWEKLDDIGGNTEYVDCNFSTQGVLNGRDAQYERQLAAQIAAATNASLDGIVFDANEPSSNVVNSGNEAVKPDDQIEDSDRAFALAMQRKYEEEQNERAARLMQEEEYALSRANASYQRQQSTRRNQSNSTGCIIM